MHIRMARQSVERGWVARFDGEVDLEFPFEFALEFAGRRTARHAVVLETGTDGVLMRLVPGLATVRHAIQPTSVPTEIASTIRVNTSSIEPSPWTTLSMPRWR